MDRALIPFCLVILLFHCNHSYASAGASSIAPMFKSMGLSAKNKCGFVWGNVDRDLSNDTILTNH